MKTPMEELSEHIISLIESLDPISNQDRIDELEKLLYDIRSKYIRLEKVRIQEAFNDALWVDDYLFERGGVNGENYYKMTYDGVDNLNTKKEFVSMEWDDIFNQVRYGNKGDLKFYLKNNFYPPVKKIDE